MEGDKVLDFVFHGGRPCLDFFNTVRRRKDPYSPTQDLLIQNDGLKNWILTAQQHSRWASQYPRLSSAASDDPVPEHILEQAIQLRGSIGRFLSKTFTQEDIHMVNQLARARPYWEFSKGEEALLAIDSLELDRALGCVAEDCIQLFSSDLAQKIKECAEERCGIVFLDRSNGGKRNWCSMKECGNRSKVSRFARK